jgi:metal-responsive CopG/Arc/MetJ family transcriptional regulator
MGKEKIAITLDERSIGELDRLVEENVFQSRSQAIQEAVSEKLQRLKKTRLIAESAKLNPAFESDLAEEGLVEDVKEWPEY